MKAYSPIRTDLVIGMTLAELFLLILFVVWYSHGPGAGKDWRRIAAEQQAEIDRLNSQVQADKARIVELEQIEDFWRRNFGISPPKTVQEVTDALKSKQGEAIRTVLLRGFPKCNDDNILIDASIRNGQSELRLRPPVNVLSEWARTAGVTVPSAGDTMTGETTTDAFFAAVDRFYSDRKAKGKPCRFDYRLTWSTDTDYRIGRQRLEAYFYPAGISAAQPIGQ